MNLSSEKQPLDLPAVEKMDDKGSGGAANVHKMRIYLLFNIAFLLLFILIIFPLAFTTVVVIIYPERKVVNSPRAMANNGGVAYISVHGLRSKRREGFCKFIVF